MQRCISSHSEVGSFPETDFFAKLIGKGKGRWLARVNVVGPERCDRAWEKLERVFGQELAPVKPKRCFHLDRAASIYMHLLDSVAVEKRNSVWLEKTPRHFRYVDVIERNIPHAIFIHMIRNGRAVVGSIVDRALRYPENFGCEREPVYAARLWNEAMRRAVRRIHQPNDLIVHHEDLVACPDRVLSKVCDRLAVEYEPAMVKGQSGDEIVGVNEVWKESVKRGVSKVDDKFEEVLSERDKRRVNRIFDWASYERLLNARSY